ncbi:uncharacterized protein TM35_000272050 [Trypanosoma theileri]|uniref:Uncharacterized protein n=1 Tax=Trypanosoma theileri TaxID=67003 RepID=A0A1X0NPI8_9TRYP|nr:uncharacterized protein TM35_000272050 [Trypanosoma theileri]ORC86615.1 hypothetical protein TM35_000272050 [Trypanosoma theileri]
MKNEHDSTTSSALVSTPSVVSDSVQAMIKAAAEFTDLLTDSTEQQLRLRTSLSALVDVLRSGTRTAAQKQGMYGAQRLVVAGSAESGKSTLVELLLKCPPSLAEVDTMEDTDNDSNGSGPAEKIPPDLFERLPTRPNVNGGAALLASSPMELPPLHPNDTSCPNEGIDDISASAVGNGGTLTMTLSSAVSGGGILFSPSFVPNNNNNNNNNHNNNNNNNHTRRERSATWETDVSMDPDETVGLSNTHLPFLRERGRRRLCRAEDEPRGKPSFKFVTVSPFPDCRLLHSTENGVLSPSVNSALHRMISMRPGSFDTTIVDRIRMRKNRIISRSSVGLRDEMIPIQQIATSTLPYNSTISHRTREFSLQTLTASVRTRTDTMKEVPITPWSLQECSGGVIRSEREGMTSYQVPDTLCGESFIFTIPAEVVGTSRMVDCMAELFGLFALPLLHNETNNDVDDLSSSPKPSQSEGKDTGSTDKDNYYHHSKNDKNGITDGRSICQLIADLTLFVLTFSDAIITRAEGVMTLDEELMKRPPPMARTLPELVTLFQKEVEKIYGISVASWQVIPFSGSMSHVTHDVLQSFFDLRVIPPVVQETETVDTDLLSSSTNTLLGPSSSSSTFMIPPAAGGGSLISLRRAISKYCDVVFGEHFNTRKSVLSEEQLEKIVWHHALTSMWEDSGAEQLFNAVKYFESNYLENFFAHAAVSLVVWCQQLKMVLPQARKFVRRRLKTCRRELQYMKKQSDARVLSITRIKKEIIPRDISRGIQSQFQEKFEELTVRFWWTLFDIIETENERCGVCPRTSKRHPASSLCHSSLPACTQARERLRKEYQAFVHLFINKSYEGQVSHLRSIITEKKQKKDGLLNSNDEVKGNEHVDSHTPKASKTSDFQRNETKKHHIPFVEHNARNFKATMEKELTLHLSRFNTEVINLFVAELVAVMPDFTRMCERQRNLVGRKLLRIFASVDYYRGYESSEKNLRSLLKTFSHLSLVELRPSSELEVFVTGLRGSLCEDQILLILRDLTQHNETQETSYASRSLAYLRKQEKEINSGEFQYKEVMHSDDPTLLDEIQDLETSFWAPLDMGDMKQHSANWMRKAASFGVERTTTTRIMEKNTRCSNASIVQFGFSSATVSSEDTGAKKQRQQEEHGEGILPKQKEERENVIIESHIMSTNPLWFLLAVWKETLSAMSFHPWVLLRSFRYGGLLNNIVSTFVKQQEHLVINLKNEISEIEAALQGIRKEMSQVVENIPMALNRLSSIATTAAHEMKALKASTVTATATSRFDV